MAFSLQVNQLHCDELHKLAEESKEKIKTVQEQYLKRADEINAMMAEKHRAEVSVNSNIVGQNFLLVDL